MRAGRAIVFALLLLAGAASPARAGEVLAAVATNFADVMGELEPVFERQTGHSLTVSTGSTGKFYAQIVNGAPYDVLLAADQKHPQMLADGGMAVDATRLTYAVGRLTLWSADLDRIGPDGNAALVRPGLLHLAIANPELAPYGLAARQTLESLGLWERLSGKIIMNENVGQAFATVATGNAELGLVALSSVLGSDRSKTGSRWDVPASLHEPIRQDAVLLEHGRSNAAAAALLEFLASEPARAVIARYGYTFE